MRADVGNWTGRTLSGGRYQVATKLSEGGMGLIYRAWDNHLESDVVVKVPLASLQGVDDFSERFLREVRSLVRLAHPHIVRVLDVDAEEGVCFAVMQFLAGGSLFDHQNRTPGGDALPTRPEGLREWLEPVAVALDFIHGQQFIHRDVKPPNILFDGHGHVYLSDFGMAKALAAILPENHGSNLTGAGMVIGTPGYVAPEQIMGQPADGRADQYGLAASVYEMLIGRNPFSGVPLSAILVHQTTTGAPPPHEACPSIPKSISLAIHRGMSIDPHARFASCSEFSRAVLQTVAIDAHSPPAGFPRTIVQPIVPFGCTVPADSSNPAEPPGQSPPPSLGRSTPATMIVPGLSNVPPAIAPAMERSMGRGLPLGARPSDERFVQTACPNCKKPLRLSSEAAGKRVRCPKCAAWADVSADLQHLLRVANNVASTLSSVKTPPPLPSPTNRPSSASPHAQLTTPPPLPANANVRRRNVTHWLLAAAGILLGVAIFFSITISVITWITGRTSSPSDAAAAPN